MTHVSEPDMGNLKRAMGFEPMTRLCSMTQPLGMRAGGKAGRYAAWMVAWGEHPGGGDMLKIQSRLARSAQPSNRDLLTRKMHYKAGEEYS